jgi:hypothetical protein
MKRLLANFDPADQESLENSVNLGKLDNPGGGNHGILGPHGKREQVLPSPHSLVFIPCIRCVPWLTTERIFYHGILGPHGKREQVLPSPHSLVFIPCIRCVPWLTTEQIFYHGILGPHGKREQVLPSPHSLVFIPCIRCVPWLRSSVPWVLGCLPCMSNHLITLSMIALG